MIQIACCHWLLNESPSKKILSQYPLLRGLHRILYICPCQAGCMRAARGNSMYCLRACPGRMLRVSEWSQSSFCLRVRKWAVAPDSAHAILRGWTPPPVMWLWQIRRRKCKEVSPQVCSHSRPADMDSVIPSQDLVATLHRHYIFLSPFPREQEFPTPGKLQGLLVLVERSALPLAHCRMETGWQSCVTQIKDVYTCLGLLASCCEACPPSNDPHLLHVQRTCGVSGLCLICTEQACVCWGTGVLTGKTTGMAWRWPLLLAEIVWSKSTKSIYIYIYICNFRPLHAPSRLVVRYWLLFAQSVHLLAHASFLCTTLLLSLLLHRSYLHPFNCFGLPPHVGRPLFGLENEP